MRVYVESYGCSQNQGEGSAIARDLAHHGHEVVGDPGRAEAGVLVTCGVIGSTEARMVRRWEALSARIPRLYVTGCLVPLRTGLFAGPGRTRTTFVPIREQNALPKLLAGTPASPTEVPDTTGSRLGVALDPPAPPATASEEVVLAQGCASGCAYCFSRLARGPLSSVPLAEVVARVRAAISRGAREVRLTSLDTSAWGLDAVDGPRLPELLRAIAEIPGDFSVRVGMMSPQTLAPIRSEYVAALADPRFYRFLHLPLQSGSDHVLSSMHRGYDAREFERSVGEARSRLPELMLSTDVIVGYPGETEEDHRATRELLERVQPENVNVTRFSPRPGTPAARAAAVGATIAKRRSRELAALRQRIARERFERWIGREGLARVVEYGPGTSAVARLPNYLPVVLEERPPLGRVVPVRIDGARSTYLLGRPVRKPF